MATNTTEQAYQNGYADGERAAEQHILNQLQTQINSLKGVDRTWLMGFQSAITTVRKTTNE